MKKKHSGSWIGAVFGAAAAAVILTLALLRRLEYLREEAEYEAFIESTLRLSMEYIYGKYGFEPELPEDESDFNRKEYDMNRDWPGIFRTRFKMKEPGSEGREFFVYTSCYLIDYFGAFAYPEAEGLCLYDFYQEEDIKDAISDKIFNAFGVKAYANMDLSGRLPYYSGDNLDEILEELSAQIEAVFPDADVYSPAARELLDKLDKNNKISYTFTFFENEDILNEFVDYTSGQKYRSLTQNTWYELYAPYIKYCIKNGSTDPEDLGFTIKSCDDFLYCYFPTASVSDDSSRVTATALERSAVTDIFEQLGEGEWVSKPLSKCYRFEDYSYGDICIYYPLEKLEQTGLETQNIGAAWFSMGGQSNNRNIARAEICGEYAVFTLPFYKQFFMLVDNTGQEEYIPGWIKSAGR